MKCVSKIFQPVITIPKNAKIKNTDVTCKSQKLLLECGLVRPTSSGLFALLPLAQRSIDKLEAIINSSLENIGAQRLSLPSLTGVGLWKKTERFEAVGSELLTLKDRHSKEYLLAPTHEEAISDLLADVGPISYKQLPLLVYQIGNKYRDELRPKHGLLRAREFLMMDAYSLHCDPDCAAHTYRHVEAAYRDVFTRLALPVHRVEAPTGDMGGSLSHEWQLRAEAGEDAINICPSCSHTSLADSEENCEKCGKETERTNSIEVGHTFVLGSRYSAPLQAHCVTQNGPPSPLVMACYGIGVTRLMAASLEALSTDKCLRWPEPIAPYKAIIIGPKEGSKEWSAFGLEKIEELYRQLNDVPGHHNDVVVDDRHQLTIGKRLMMADRMGYPTIIVCGRATLESTPKLEVYRNGGQPTEVPIDGLTAHLIDNYELSAGSHKMAVA